MMTARVYNFSAGPAMIPEPVLQQARDELLDWHGSGMSIMEMSHRGDAFQSVAHESERDLRELLQVPDHYHILFLQGGGRLQFAMIPMNLLNGAKNAAYADTGLWSQSAITEAKQYCDVTLATSGKASNYTTIPELSSWDIPKNSAYLYYTDNETINGVEFPYIPETDVLLVNDMSSNFLTRPVDISRFGLIFSCAQKNVGPAGLTIVIIRDDLLRYTVWPKTPQILRYATHAAEKSVWNTPPTFAWYMAGLNFKWLKAQGGVEAIANINQKKSDKLYRFIDSSNFYSNKVEPAYRSRVNIPFSLSAENLDKTFLTEAEKNGLTNLKGHKLVGGMRASIYNAMPEAGIDALITFMQDFAKRYG